ncbi:MAG TPA: oxygen-dependent coproporphyrinogen oxidase [Catalimonadaceae bacterium]|nr:oxygen-dependent coproporphyrinogen oxidase [Catalimonadaceae bacterium]HPI12121.1 oxygen-dependent coproporphyrinogen oxidase [Catalimonadaceae bacterium]
MERKDEIKYWFRGLQSSIIQALEKEDGSGIFSEEHWERPGGGGGITRLLKDGSVIEKGGVNFSAVHGETPEPIKRSFQSDAKDFFATGVSIVIHSRNPFVPIIHMNVRYFELSDGNSWFGGGIDLTPSYVFHEDGVFFHSALKEVCDQFDMSWYPQYKSQADSYFYIRHRNETRGIGGIFYDRLAAKEPENFAKLWEFTKQVGSAFAPIYTTLMARRKDTPFTPEQKFWQLHRRSRYVEFNLVYDAGTKFGLETNGRVESILMSLPPMACWESNYVPTKNSPEFESQKYFDNSTDWI